MQHLFYKYRYPLVLLLMWWVVATAVNPEGAFPLNDDFSFAKSVYHWCVQGRFQFDDWLAMTLFTQMAYGAVWCQLFGFSFEVLRWSSLLAAAVALLILWKLLLLRGASIQQAFVAVLVLAFNPLFFSLSFTFMTDVHFVAWMLAALWVWLCYLKTASTHHYVAALLLTLALVFLRQTGLMVSLAAFAAMAVGQRRTVGVWFRALLPLLIAGGALLIWYLWLDAFQGLPATFGHPSKLLHNLVSPDHLALLPQRLTVLTAYLGVFFLPLTMGLRAEKFTEGKKWWHFALMAIYLLAGWHFREKIPWGNILYNLGLGPPTLKDGQFFLNLKYQLSGWGLEGLRLFFIASGGWFLWQCPRIFKRPTTDADTWLISTYLAAYLAFLLADTYAFDRYFLVAIPLLLLLIAFGNKNWRLRPVSWAVLLLMATFSVAATHDYLSWNRARWAALHHLTSDCNIPPEKIDGGFEFNGWFKPGRLEHGRAKSWWWVKDDDYCITFGPLDGFRCIRKFHFERWLPPASDSLCILRKF